MAPVARDKKTLLLVNGDETEILKFTDMQPQSVHVTYNNDVQKLTVTEVNLMLKLLVDLE